MTKNYKANVGYIELRQKNSEWLGKDKQFLKDKFLYTLL